MNHIPDPKNFDWNFRSDEEITITVDRRTLECAVIYTAPFNLMAAIKLMKRLYPELSISEAKAKVEEYLPAFRLRVHKILNRIRKPIETKPL